MQRFTDRILILVTQLHKVGALYQASAPLNSLPSVQRIREPTTSELQELHLPPPDPSLAVSKLMGSVSSEEQETLHHLYVSELASLVFGGLGTLPEDVDMDTYQPFEGRTVVVGLALKDVRKSGSLEQQQSLEEVGKLERTTFAQVAKLALACRVW